MGLGAHSLLTGSILLFAGLAASLSVHAYEDDRYEFMRQDYLRRKGYVPKDTSWDETRGIYTRRDAERWGRQRDVTERPPIVNVPDDPRGPTPPRRPGPIPPGTQFHQPLHQPPRNALAEEIMRRPTWHQLNCRRKAQARGRPGKIAFGFTGLMSYPIFLPAIKGMMGSSRNQTEFHGYAWDSVSRHRITDAARCAYEYATTPYYDRDGRPVYNTIIVLGHSFGGGAAYKMAHSLQKLGVSVDLVATADAREPENCLRGCSPNWGRPHSVGRWLNFYQLGGLRGFQIGGAQTNRFVAGHDHMSIPTSATLRNAVSSAVHYMPSCRSSYAMYVQHSPRVNCNASASPQYAMRAPASYDRRAGR